MSEMSDASPHLWQEPAKQLIRTRIMMAGEDGPRWPKGAGAAVMVPNRMGIATPVLVTASKPAANGVGVSWAAFDHQAQG